MAPEYGATCGFFPIDDETLKYLNFSGRDKQTVNIVEAYANTGKGMDGVISSIFAEVLSSSAGTGDSGVMLDVRDYGTISANEVIKFRM